MNDFVSGFYVMVYREIVFLYNIIIVYCGIDFGFFFGKIGVEKIGYVFMIV